MSTEINGSTGVSLVQDGVIVTADMASSVPLGTKNKIINGNLGINQRAVTGSVVLVLVFMDMIDGKRELRMFLYLCTTAMLLLLHISWFILQLLKE